MKKVIIIGLMGLFLLTGCSASLRQVKETKVEKNYEKVSVEALSTTALATSGVTEEEAGLKVKLTNNSENAITINWSNSSINYSGYISSIITGNNRGVNLVATVPVTTLPPKASINISIFPREALSPVYGSYGMIVGYKTEPSFDESSDCTITLAISEENSTTFKYHISKINYSL